MVKKDTIVWVNKDQLISEAVSHEILNRGSVTPLPQPPPKQQQQQQLDSPQPQISWSVWDEVQMLVSRRLPPLSQLNRQPPPAIVQRLESHGYNNVALAMSLVLSLFPWPSPSRNDDVVSTIQSPQLEKTMRINGGNQQINVSTVDPRKDNARLVLRRALHSDLEASKGLAVIAHDAYWEEHERRRRHATH